MTLRIRNSPEPGNKGEVEVENILQPLDGSSGLVCEDLDQIGTRLISGGFEGIIVESLDAVGDAQVDLGARQGAVNTGRSLGGVATEEGCFGQFLRGFEQ